MCFWRFLYFWFMDWFYLYLFIYICYSLGLGEFGWIVLSTHLDAFLVWGLGCRWWSCAWAPLYLLFSGCGRSSFPFGNWTLFFDPRLWLFLSKTLLLKFKHTLWHSSFFILCILHLLDIFIFSHSFVVFIIFKVFKFKLLSWCY